MISCSVHIIGHFEVILSQICCASRMHPNGPQILTTSLTGHLVDKLTFSLKT